MSDVENVEWSIFVFILESKLSPLLCFPMTLNIEQHPSILKQFTF